MIFNQISSADLIKILALLVPTITAIWIMLKVNELIKKKKEILSLKSQIDNIEEDIESKHIINSGMVNQSQFEKMIQKRRKPMEAKLETLKLER